MAEPTAATVPSPVALTPLPTAPPGQLTAPVGAENESLVPALWALDRCRILCGQCAIVLSM